MSRTSSVWVDKYSPTKLNDLILTENNLKFLKGCIEKHEIPNILLHGTAGIGKTTLGIVLRNELNCEFIYINGSEERSIDTIRNIVIPFAQTSSFAYLNGETKTRFKIIFIDECEQLTPVAQDSLKVITEQYMNNARFIFATNNVNKLIDPLRNRCQEITLVPSKQNDRLDLSKKYYHHILNILQKENVTITDNNIIIELINKRFPSMRKIIHILNQAYNTFGQIDSNTLNITDVIDKRVIESLKSKDAVKVRKISANIDPNDFYTEFIENFENIIVEEDYYKAMLIIGDGLKYNIGDDSQHILFYIMLRLSNEIKFK